MVSSKVHEVLSNTTRWQWDIERRERYKGMVVQCYVVRISATLCASTTPLLTKRSRV